MTSVRTARLLLRHWRAEDYAPFAAMQVHPDVAAGLGGVLSADQAAAKLERYSKMFSERGYGRWAVELEGRLIGYAGVMPALADHPLGPHDEIGWCLAREAWGHGYATEAASAALADALTRMRMPEVLAYTTPDNLRSQSVIGRLPFQRDAARDFTGRRPAMVWSARGPLIAAAALIRKGRILLGRRASHRRAFPGCWDMIGGHLEPGETHEAALVRELREELGIEAQTFSVVGDFDLPSGAALRLFRVDGWSGGEPRLANDEHSDLRWFTVEEAAVLPDLVLPDYVTVIRRLGSRCSPSGGAVGEAD